MVLYSVQIVAGWARMFEFYCHRRVEPSSFLRIVSDTPYICIGLQHDASSPYDGPLSILATSPTKILRSTPCTGEFETLPAN